LAPRHEGNLLPLGQRVGSRARRDQADRRLRRRRKVSRIIATLFYCLVGLERRNDAEKALAQCRHGDAAASIPVLERKLADNRITLTQRR